MMTIDQETEITDEESDVFLSRRSRLPHRSRR